LVPNTKLQANNQQSSSKIFHSFSEEKAKKKDHNVNEKALPILSSNVPQFESTLPNWLDIEMESDNYWNWPLASHPLKLERNREE